MLFLCGIASLYIAPIDVLANDGAMLTATPARRPAYTICYCANFSNATTNTTYYRYQCALSVACSCQLNGLRLVLILTHTSVDANTTPDRHPAELSGTIIR